MNMTRTKVTGGTVVTLTGADIMSAFDKDDIESVYHAFCPGLLEESDRRGVAFDDQDEYPDCGPGFYVRRPITLSFGGAEHTVKITEPTIVVGLLGDSDA